MYVFSPSFLLWERCQVSSVFSGGRVTRGGLALPGGAKGVCVEALKENLLQASFVSNSYSLFVTFSSGGWNVHFPGPLADKDGRVITS